MHLKVAVVNFAHFFSIQKLESGFYEGVEGVDFELLKILSQVINFTYDIMQPDDRKWGGLKEDGSWSGMIGMLQKSDADMAIDCIALTYARSEVIDFSFPYKIDYDSFMIKKAGTMAKTFFFVRPFQLLVWTIIAVFLLLSAVILACLQHSNLHGKRKNHHHIFRNTFTAAEMLIGNHPLGSLFGKCGTRIFFTLSALPIRVLMLCFSGLLLSFLMTPAMEYQMKTVEELAKASQAGKVKVTVHKDAQLDLAFKQAETGILKDLSKNLQNYPADTIASDVDIIEKTLNGYAFMAARIILIENSYKAEINGKMFISKDSLKSNLIGIMFKKNFCCVKKFDQTILRVYQSGVYEKVIKHESFKRDMKRKLNEHLKKEQVKPIDVQDLVGVFGLLICGYAIAVVALVFEKCKGKPSRSERSKNRRPIYVSRNNDY